MKRLLQQAVKFGIIGVIAFLIDFGILYVLTEYGGIYHLISQIFSFIISFLFNYYFSVIWVFDVKHKVKKYEKTLFMVGAVVGLLINESVLYLLTVVMCMHYLYAKLISTVIVMVWNFVTRKYFLEKNI